MDHDKQIFLARMATHVGAKLGFAAGLPIQFCGMHHGEYRTILINADQPECEQVFTILHEIAHCVLHNGSPRPGSWAWLLDRPHENEFLGQVGHNTRRLLRQKGFTEFEADLWALCAFCETGWTSDLKDFLQRHPDKLKLLLLVLPAVLKGRFITRFKQLLRSFQGRSLAA